MSRGIGHFPFQVVVYYLIPIFSLKLSIVINLGDPCGKHKEIQLFVPLACSAVPLFHISKHPYQKIICLLIGRCN